MARDALQFTAENSVAHVYLQHQANIAEAALDGGMQYGAASVDKIDGGYELCEGIDPVCNEFTGLVPVGGAVADLLVNGQAPGSRLAVGDGSVVESKDVAARFLTAYVSIAGESLFVTVEVATGAAAAELYLYSAISRAPDGRQRQAAEAPGPDELGP